MPLIQRGDHDTRQIDWPSVSLVLVCRNEVSHITDAIHSLLAQDYPEDKTEILVCDGMSDDGTRDEVGTLSEQHAPLRLVDNPGLTVPHAMNAGIRAARHEVIVRIDAHSRYAEDYVRQCVTALIESGADVVGGPWCAVGDGRVSRAVAAAFHSRFGMGGGRSHDTEYEGSVDTVYLGCWRRETLECLGLFDEGLTRNQDDELNLRVRRQGGTIYQTPRIKSVYTPRNSLRQLFRQYYQYGFWKVRVIQKHRLPASFRHLVPALFVVALALGALAVLFVGRTLLPIYLGGLGLYVVTNLGASLLAGAGESVSTRVLLPAVFGVFHVGYGTGFLAGVLHFVVLRRTSGDAGTHADGLSR